MTKEQKILEWAEMKMRAEFVTLVSKKFQFLILSNEQDTRAVMQVVDDIIGTVTGIGDLSGTGLGISAYGFPSGRRFTADED